MRWFALGKSRLLLITAAVFHQGLNYRGLGFEISGHHQRKGTIIKCIIISACIYQTAKYKTWDLNER